MKMYFKKPNCLKAQSILEYLIVLAAIFIAIVINTVGFSTGIQNSLGLQNSLNTTQNIIETGIIRNATPPQSVTGEAYYKQPSENVADPALTNPNVNNMDKYGGPEYTGGYNYDEWVRNNPDSAYNAPEGGYIYPQANNANAASTNK